MFELFEHEADIGVRGKGSTLREAFEECAKAMFSVMVDLHGVEPKEEVGVRARARNRSELLIEWLNVLLSEASLREMFFSEFMAEISERNGELVLAGKARGEKIDREKHSIDVEVKGATYSQLVAEKRGGEFVAQCVVDV